MNEKKEQKVQEETLVIQNQEVNLEREEENPGIGYEIVIGLSDKID